MQSLKKAAEENKEATYVMAAIGTAWVAAKLGHAAYSAYKYTLRPSKDLKVRYGDGWAIVVGA
jgi:hypothetical protein